jgi:hypothetical protein
MLKKLNEQIIETDFCVIGGGMAGISAAITAARLGAKTVIIHERPVFGGNASGEIRMWICGVQDYAYKETGLLEEISLENYHYNPDKRYPLWDALLYGKVINESNIIPFLNCTCFDAQMDGNRIVSVTAYQMTTQSFVTVKARVFADCSGDSILAPLTGAKYDYGREGKDEYGESMIQTRDQRDCMTMGNSCLIQERKTNKKVEFHAPSWAEKISVEKLKSKGVNLHAPWENFWYIEIGGYDNVIKNAENYNKRLIAICLGVWDTIKNSGEFDADYFDIDFIGFLAAKRESRRMKGDYVMTANDVVERRVFPDEVAYGGWPLDDHNPYGLDGEWGNYTIRVSPYGIPHRCLYSENIENLYFAGRNISMTHMAMSSARVMGTCTTLGQAVGVSASIAAREGLTPRQVGQEKIDELQQTLLQMDCFLPNIPRKVRGENLDAAKGRYAVLVNGKDRNICGEENGLYVGLGEEIVYNFKVPVHADKIKIVFDSDLQRISFGDMHECEKHHTMRCNILDDSPRMFVPKTLARDFSVEIEYEDGRIERKEFKDNLRRNVLIAVGEKIKKMKLAVKSNWGNTNSTRVFTFEVI